MARTSIAIVAGMLALAACGTSTQERALSGAGIGAAAGAGIAAVTDADLLAGGLIGAALGAAAGGLTDEETIDLGEPIWE